MGKIFSFVFGEQHISTKMKTIELKILKKRSLTYCYNRPSKAIISITSRCNFNCIWCNRNNYDFGNVDTDKDNVLNVISKLWNLNSIILAGYGEVLLYPIDDLVEIIKKAKTNS